MIKIYFSKADVELKETDRIYDRFVQVLENLGFKLLVDTPQKKANLDKADIFIVEVSELTSRVGYIVAYALSRRKPVFCLYQKKLIAYKELSYLSQGVTEKLIKIEPYTMEDLHIVLENYLRQKQKREIATTKFTLRVPASFVEYLDWKKVKSGRSKASLIRDEFMNKIIDRDKDFQKHLSEKRHSR